MCYRHRSTFPEGTNSTEAEVQTRRDHVQHRGTVPQGDLRLLETELAQELLHSAIPARLAFVAADGTPRVVPTWFEWDGTEIVMVTYVAGPEAGIRHPAARIAALRANPAVALTIDTDEFPATEPDRCAATPRSTRSTAWRPSTSRRHVATSATTAAAGMLAAMDQPGTVQARIAVRPTWVGLLDFATRLPGPLGGVQA